MDLVSGLSAASTAIGIAKDLREIDRSVDEAGYKLKIAELVEALSDTKIALADANSKFSQLETELDEFRNGKVCPKCRESRLQLVENVPQRTGGLGRHGVEVWTYACVEPTCDFKQRHIHDPLGLTQKHVAKR